MIIDSPIISGSYAATGSLNQVGNVTITGSLTVTGPIIGVLTGSVDSASFATTASYVSPNTQINSASFAITASYVSPNTQITSASFAITSSYAKTVDFNNTVVTSSFAVTASYVSPNTQINTASFAITASYVSPNTQINSASFAITASYVSPNTQINTASFAITASYASNADLLDGLDSSAFTSVSSFNVFTSSASSRLSSLETASGSAISRLNALEVTSGSNITRISALEVASGSAIGRLNAIELTTGSLNTASGSAITRLNALEVASGSAITRLDALETASGSAINRLNTIENKTGSYATTGSNTFVGGQYFSSSFNPTGFTTTASLYTDGGLRVGRDAYISGTLYLNNLTVFGTQSVAYISSSQLNIGTNIINVNTDTPSVRFGGLAVYDSGSTGLTGSMLWDSQNNHWVYSNPSGSTYSGGMLISGPRASSLGSEQGTTSNALMKGQGGDHITSSGIFESGSGNVGIGTSVPAYKLDVQGTYGQSSTSTQPVTIYGDSGDTNGLFRIQMDSISDSFGTGARTFLGDGGIDLFLGTANSSYTPNNTYIALNHSGEISMGAGSATKHLVINTNGNVGIGTTSPNFKLQVDHATTSQYVALFRNTADNLQLKIGTTTGGYLNIQGTTLSNTTYSISLQADGGNVGIGTTTPSQKFHIMSGSVLAEGGGTNNGIIIGAAGNNVGGAIKAKGVTNEMMYFDSTNTVLNGESNIYLRIANSDKVTINSSGNVGIGTTSPTTTLHVRTDTGVLIKGSSSDSDAILSFLPASGGRQYNFRNYGSSFGIQDASADNIRMYFHFNGNVGIGDSGPSSRLHVYTNGTGSSYNGIGIDNGAQEHYWYLEDNFTSVYNIGSTSGKWKWSNSNGTHVTILSGGSVGIGTTSPAYLFDVNGTGRFTGNIVTTGATAEIMANGAGSSNTVGGSSRFTILDSSNTRGWILQQNASYNLSFWHFNGGWSNVINFTPAGAATFSSTIAATSATFNSDFLTNETSKVGISFASGYGQINSWGANTSTYGGLKFQLSVSNGATTTPLIILPSGNIGIGTTSPAAPLHVASENNNNDGTIKFGIRGWLQHRDAGQTITSLANDYNDNSAKMEFRMKGNTSADAKMIILGSGNVGIGTTSPAALLDISSAAAGYAYTSYQSYSGATRWYVGAGNSGVTIQSFGIGTSNTGNNPFFMISSGGLVGVGTTNPIGSSTERTIELAGGSNNSTFYVTKSSTGIRSILGASDNGTIVGAQSNHNVTIVTNDTTRILITAGGNVGIGTTSPDDKLEIRSGYLRMSDPSSTTGAGYAIMWSSNNGGTNVTYANIDAVTTSAGNRTGDLIFRTSNAGAPSEKVRITSGGTLKMASATISNNNAVFAAGEFGGYKYFQGTLANGEKFGSQGGTYVLGFYFITWFDGSSSRGYAMYATTNPASNAGTVLISSGGTYTASATYNASSAVSLAFDGSVRGAVLSNNTGVSLTFYAYVFGGV